MVEKNVEEKQKLRESVKHSLMAYRDARVERRELLGPDLIDTIGDISKATTSAAIDKAKEIKEVLTNKTNDVKDRTKSMFIDLKGKMSEYTSNTKTAVGNIANRVKAGIGKMREGISDFVKSRTEVDGIRKHEFADNVRRNTGGFRSKLADKLEILTDIVRGREREVAVEDQNKSDTKNVLMRDKTEIVRNDIRTTPSKDNLTDEKKQIKLEGTKNTQKEMKSFNHEDTVEFIKYYLQNRNTVRDAFDKLDNQKNPEPKFSDYMIASGFATFMEEMRSNDVKVESQVEVKSEDPLSQVRQIVDLIEQQLEGKHGLKQEPHLPNKVSDEPQIEPIKQPKGEEHNTNVILTPDDLNVGNSSNKSVSHGDVIITEDDLSEFQNMGTDLRL